MPLVKISSKSFFQVNPIQVEKLYSKAIELAKLNKDDVVLDAYAGVGTIGMICSKYVKHVDSVELVHSAVVNARDNAKRNNINNISLVEMDCTKYLMENEKHYDVVIMDPPRKGSSEEFLNALKKNRPDRIVYISCESSTLARDLALLTDAYEVIEVQPVDMFSRSFHCETVVSLCLKSRT